MKLTSEVKDLYIGNYKTLTKEIEEMEMEGYPEFMGWKN